MIKSRRMDRMVAEGQLFGLGNLRNCEGLLGKTDRTGYKKRIWSANWIP